MAKKSNAKLVRIGIVAVFGVVAVGLAVTQMQAAKKVAAETAAAWMITGAACPVPAPGAGLPPLTHPNALEDAAILREVHGAVACNTVKENGDGDTLGICQYITPGAMKVTTAKGTYSFQPPRGVDASLIVRDGVPSCVQHVNPALFLQR
ncbi:MAG: hypothetical protein B7Y99_10625 [Caulobacterales bacterium 32-69-10]|nr:MAG: hypothetical protein B7Y99_10625 [Caulobacterales bacterium 32-69-10]